MSRSSRAQTPWRTSSSPAPKTSPPARRDIRSASSGRSRDTPSRPSGSSAPRRSPAKQTAEELEAETVDTLSNSLLRMRGAVRWQHERDLRAEQAAAIQATEASLQDRVAALENSLQHVAEVVHILRCTEAELTDVRRREILTPAQDVRTFDSFASALFSPVPDRSTTGRTPGRSDQWPNADPEAGRDAFRDFALRLSGIGRRYYELQMDRQLAVVDEECRRMVLAAEEDGEAAWADAVNAVNQEWEEGGVRRQDFGRYVDAARQAQDAAVLEYVAAQEATAAQFAQHEAHAELERMKSQFERAATAFYDRQVQRAHGDLAAVQAVAARADAYRGWGAAEAAASLSEANAISATSVVQAQQCAHRVQAGVAAMRQTELTTLDKCVRYVLQTEVRRGSKVFAGPAVERQERALLVLAAWADPTER